jgi:hypothetical protein
MVAGRNAARLVLAGIVFLLAACGTAQDNIVSVNLDLPADWESVIDMDALGAPTSTPYIGTIRFVYGGTRAQHRDFPYAGQSASFNASGLENLTVQALTAGQVIMEGSVSGLRAVSGDVTVYLEKANGFSEAGTLLYPRQMHSTVYTNGVAYVLGGNTNTRVIEAVASSAGSFVSSAYASSLVYPRDEATVLHDTTGNQLFVLKGATAVDDNLYEIVDLENESSFSMTLKLYRDDYFPILFNQNLYLIAGYNLSSNWLIDTTVIQTNMLTESIAPLMGIASERYNYQCLNNGSNLICAGGSEGINYLNEIVRIDLVGEQNMISTTLSSPKEHFSLLLLSNNRILITGGVGNAGYLNEVEIIDLQDGSSVLLGNGLVRQRARHDSVLIKNDLVLIVGGLEPAQISHTAELLDLTTGESTLLPWRMKVPRVGHTATLLPDGRVLVAGGSATDRRMEVFNPRSGL